MIFETTGHICHFRMTSKRILFLSRALNALLANPENALSWKEVPKDLVEWRNRDSGVLSGAASAATPPLIRYLNADSFKGSLFVVILLLNCT